MKMKSKRWYRSRKIPYSRNLTYFFFVCDVYSPVIISMNSVKHQSFHYHFQTILTFNFIKKIFTIEINGSRTIGINFFDHHVELSVGELVIKFFQDFSQTWCGNVTISYKKPSVFYPNENFWSLKSDIILYLLCHKAWRLPSTLFAWLQHLLQRWIWQQGWRIPQIQGDRTLSNKLKIIYIWKNMYINVGNDSYYQHRLLRWVLRGFSYWKVDPSNAKCRPPSRLECCLNGCDRSHWKPSAILQNKFNIKNQ